jgi:peptidoglycan-associated lipoprotein
VKKNFVPFHLHRHFGNEFFATISSIEPASFVYPLTVLDSSWKSYHIVVCFLLPQSEDPDSLRAAFRLQYQQFRRMRKMKNLFALLLAASMLLAGCAKKQIVDDQAINEPEPVVVEQEVPVVAVEEPVEVPVVKEFIAKRPAVKIFFDFNSSTLSPASKEALESKARWLQAQPEVRIVIQGHTDERGSDKYNLALGKKRAQAARDYLVTLGVAPGRITTVSYGKEKATKGAANNIIWAKERRAEFVTAD